MALRRAAGWGLLLAALAANPNLGAAATSLDGRRAYDADRFEEARRIWMPLAEANDGEAQLGLGLLYDLGQGVPKDPAAAYGWYRRAAGAGLAQGQFNVAVMRDSGVGVARDTAEAATWYAKAAARGHARARYNLAQLYAAGDGVPRNPALARAWYRAAAQSGLTAAAGKLAGLGRAEARPGASPAPAGGADGPMPATPIAPTGGAVIDAEDEPATVELVWTALAQAAPVRFFVQVLALEGEDTSEVFTGYVDESATLARLAPASYAWRVYAVAPGMPRYTVGDWRRFRVGRRCEEPVFACGPGELSAARR